MATLKLEFDDTNAWAAGLAEDLQGVLPGPVAGGERERLRRVRRRRRRFTKPRTFRPRLAAEADPVAVDSRTDAPDPTDAATTVTTVECAVPAGVGGLLTVALVSTSGDESAPIHNATRLEPAARVRRHSLDVFARRGADDGRDGDRVHRRGLRGAHAVLVLQGLRADGRSRGRRERGARRCVAPAGRAPPRRRWRLRTGASAISGSTITPRRRCYRCARAAARGSGR